mmetsp:Transcript_55846/g.104770  ORF Transcript_55846/g.104770 Transcript_55846/m.104770 type:complete len:278 (-) Transcript_55846:108-941(-)
MGGKCGLSKEVGGKVQLDGSWGFKAQLKALGAYNQEEDFGFKENSVKEVTDGGRSEGIARLQATLQECAEQLPVPSKKRKALLSGNEDDRKIAEALTAAEGELCKNVLALLAPLKELEQVAGQVESEKAVLAIFQQLKRLNLTSDCLKATRIPLELNKPCWRGSQATPMVRNTATALIKSWRTTFRADTGHSTEAGVASRKRQLRLLAVDLEDQVFNQCQKMDQYCRLIESLTQELSRSQDVCQSFMQGRTSGQDLIAKSINLPLRREQSTEVHVVD